MAKFTNVALKRSGAYILDKFGIKVELRKKRPTWPGQEHRFDYQKRFVKFAIKRGERVLDIGNGGDPFPYATVLMDRFVDPSLTNTRTETLVTHDKPFVRADIHDLPFQNKSFDYIYCAHVLEVVENPLRACQEIMRIGKRGFIETPTAGKDMLFAWAKGLQKWHVVAIGRNLYFFEYSPRQLDGINSHVWRELILSDHHNSLQEVFYQNLDVFNVMFTWEDQFSVFVSRLDGTVQVLNAKIEFCRGNSHSHL